MQSQFALISVLWYGLANHPWWGQWLPFSWRSGSNSSSSMSASKSFFHKFCPSSSVTTSMTTTRLPYTLPSPELMIALSPQFICISEPICSLVGRLCKRKAWVARSWKCPMCVWSCNVQVIYIVTCLTRVETRALHTWPNTKKVWVCKARTKQHHCEHLPKTRTSVLLSALPILFWATHVYVPLL